MHLKRSAPGLILGGFSWGRQPMRLSCIVARTHKVKDSPPLHRSGLTIDPAKSPDVAEFMKRVREALEKLREAEAKLPPAI